MKQTVRTDASDSGAKPPRNAPMSVLDKGRFALAWFGKIVDLDAHNSQGPDPCGVKLEDGRNFLPWSREQGIDVRHGECRGVLFLFIIIWGGYLYYVEEVNFLEKTGA